jgi:hypothetical protein
MKASDTVLAWLLEEEDPGVRYFALRDLLDAPLHDARLGEARRATVHASPVREILTAQKEEGYWIEAGAGYYPKYRGTAWSVIFLGQFGADGEDARVQRAGRYVLEHSPSAYGGFSAGGDPGGMIHCLQGNLCSSLLELGFADDPRLQKAIDWLARSITGEGISPAEERQAEIRYRRSGNSGPGFCCSANDHLPCAWGAVPALEALGKVPSPLRSASIAKAIQAGVEFLFSRDPATADYPMGYRDKPSRSWTQFGYPMGYVTDVLRNVEALASLGYANDPRLHKAADFILSKRDGEGRWKLEYSYAGKIWSDLGEKGAPNKWVTLRARRALHRMGIEP